MYVGLAMEHKILLSGFRQTDWSTTGHGNYLLGYNGYTYSHSDISANNKFAKVCFDVGSYVDLVFDQDKLELQISCR